MGKKDFEDLWADLQRIGDRVEKHFIGNIILLSEQDSNQLQIVDGQQRMATISLLVMAIRDHPHTSDDNKIIDDLLNCYNQEQEVTQPTRRIVLYDDDADETFQKIWSGNTSDTDDKVGAAYSFFKSKLKSLSEDKLSNTLFKVAQKLKVVRTKAEDPSLAYMIFQSQNERGVEVEPEVLIKARVFGEADRADNPTEAQEIK